MLPVPFDQLQKHQTKRRTLSKGDIVFREGEPTRGMFFIVNGAVELCLGFQSPVRHSVIMPLNT